MKAEDIYNLLLQVIQMSSNLGLHIQSFGADGAPCEMRAQNLIKEGKYTNTFLTFNDDLYNIHLKVCFIIL